VNPVLGWTLAAAALVAGWFAYRWPGVLMALSAVVFWLLLQFSRTLRVMRAAAARPVGSVDSAVMLHSKLSHGMRLLQILPLTRNLGQKVGDAPASFLWRDAGGDAVRIEFRDGRLSAWHLERAGDGGGS